MFLCVRQREGQRSRREGRGEREQNQTPINLSLAATHTSVFGFTFHTTARENLDQEEVAQFSIKLK